MSGHELDRSDYWQREEYMTQLAADRDGVAGLVIDQLDALLYEQGSVTSESYSISVDPDRQLTKRSFTYLQGDVRSWVWPLTETRLDLTHRQDKVRACNSYQVAVRWAVHQSGVSPDMFTTNYGLDVYAAGPIQAYIEQPLLEEDGRWNVRKITPYDLDELYTQLDRVSQVHTAELSDNNRTGLA